MTAMDPTCAIRTDPSEARVMRDLVPAGRVPGTPRPPRAILPCRNGAHYRVCRVRDDVAGSGGGDDPGWRSRSCASHPAATRATAAPAEAWPAPRVCARRAAGARVARSTRAPARRKG